MSQKLEAKPLTHRSSLSSGYNRGIAMGTARNNVFIALELAHGTSIGKVQIALEALAMTQASLFRFALRKHPLDREEMRQIVLSRVETKIATAVSQVRAYLEACRLEKFKLGDEALFRFLIIDDQIHHRIVVAAVMHPSISDSDSAVVFIDLFSEFLQGKVDKCMDDISVQADVLTCYKHSVSNEQEIESSNQFWRVALQGVPMTLRLPTDRIGLRQTTVPGGMVELSLEHYLDVNLQSISSGQPMFIEILSVYLVLLARYSGESIFGVEVSHPKIRYPQRNRTIDDITDNIALCVDLTQTPTFKELKNKVHAQWEKCVAHSHVDYHNNFDESQSTAVPRFLNVAFGNTQPVNETKYSSILFEQKCAVALDHDLRLNVIEKAGSVCLQLYYNTGLFEEHTAKRMADHLSLLARRAYENPEENVYSYDFLSNEERLTQLNDWNQTDFDYPVKYSINEHFEQQARRQLDAIAVVFNNSSLSYGELLRRSNALAVHLSNRGLKPHEFAAVCVDRGIEMVVAMLAIMKVGAAYLPLAPDDSTTIIESKLKDSNAKLLLVDQLHNGRFSQNDTVTLVNVLEPSVYLSDDVAFVSGSSIESNSADAPKQGVMAFLIYTSGSTNAPKGVIGLHRSIVNRVFWGESRFPTTSTDVACQRTGLNYVDHTIEIFSSLITGTRLLVLQQGTDNNIRQMIESMTVHRVSRITVLPSVLSMLMDNVKAHELRDLRYVFCSGDVLTARMVARFYRQFSQARLVNMYGATETGADSTFYEVNQGEHFDVADYFKRTKQNDMSVSKDRYGLMDAGELFTRNNMITQPNISLEELKAQFSDTTLRNVPMPRSEYLDALQHDVYPYLINVSSQHYIGHMTSALPSFVGDLSKSIAEMNQNMVKIETSKALTFVERQVLGTLHRLFYNESDFCYETVVQDSDYVFGVVTSGGSTAKRYSVAVCKK